MMMKIVTLINKLWTDEEIKLLFEDIVTESLGGVVSDEFEISERDRLLRFQYLYEDD